MHDLDQELLESVSHRFKTIDSVPSGYHYPDFFCSPSTSSNTPQSSKTNRLQATVVQSISHREPLHND